MASTGVINEQNNENTNPSPQKVEQPVICVFCGASDGTSPIHLEAARQLAHALHDNNAKLVYGGGTVGVMGELAKTLVSLSGPNSVHGIIPEALMKHERKNIDPGIYGRTTTVKDMHARKHMMAEEVIKGGHGSGFVALSGGYGTMEEIMEVTTWNQLGIHARGVVLFNVEGYWDGLLQWVNKAVESGFVTKKNRWIMVEATSAAQVVQELREYVPSKDRLPLEWKDT